MSRLHLEPGDKSKLQTHAGNLRDRLLIEVLCTTGCRLVDAVDLTKVDVDLERGTMQIVERGPAREKTDETAGIREILLEPATVALFREYFARGGCVRKGDRLLVFGIGTRRARDVVKACAEKARLLGP